MTDPLDRALRPELLPAELELEFVGELARKSDLVWVQVGADAARPVWSHWHDEAIALVTGGREQPDPGLTDSATVTVILRSKENRSRQATVKAQVEHLPPHTPAWEAAVKALHPKRLNSTDGEQQPERWAGESDVWLLRPVELLAQPGTHDRSALRAEPLPTPGTTVSRTPFHAGGATRKRR